jgi:hypothetical protein
MNRGPIVGFAERRDEALACIRLRQETKAAIQVVQAGVSWGANNQSTENALAAY